VAKSQPEKSGLADLIKKNLRESRPGFRAWHERVAPEHMDELLEVRRQWQAGELGTQLRPVAKLLAQELQARGISTIGIQGVQAWLRNQD
jgi:hypothetical protein